MLIESKNLVASFCSETGDVRFQTGIYFDGDAEHSRKDAIRIINTAQRWLDAVLEAAGATAARVEIEYGQLRTVKTGPEQLRRVEHFPYLLTDLAVQGITSQVPIRWQHVGPRPLDRFQFDLSDEIEPQIKAALAGTVVDVPFNGPVVLLPYPACQLIHECIGHTSEADNALDYALPAGLGPGTRWTAEPIRVFDDPTHPGMRSTFSYDDEGVPTQRTLLVDNGVWTGLLCDTSHSHLAGGATGHARKTFGAPSPLPRMSNTWMAPGRDTLTRMIRRVERGLLCGGTWGGGSVGLNFVVRPAYGEMIEDGKLTGKYLRRFDLRGEKFKTVASLSGVGDHVKWHAPLYGCDKFGQNNLAVSFGAPALLLEQCAVHPIG